MGTPKFSFGTLGSFFLFKKQKQKNKQKNKKQKNDSKNSSKFCPNLNYGPNQ
jgi:hypothetical protein